MTKFSSTMGKLSLNQNFITLHMFFMVQFYRDSCLINSEYYSWHIISWIWGILSVEGGSSYSIAFYCFFSVKLFFRNELAYKMHRQPVIKKSKILKSTNTPSKDLSQFHLCSSLKKNTKWCSIGSLHVFACWNWMTSIFDFKLTLKKIHYNCWEGMTNQFMGYCVHP